jgi:C-terminal processing protease CtpA/Prc
LNYIKNIYKRVKRKNKIITNKNRVLCFVLPAHFHFKYTNPVVLWINGASLSGAELFPEVMKQLPNVTVVGDTTLGGGCNDVADGIQGDYWLPSGKYIHIGTTYVLRYDGEPIEWNSVLADIRVPQSKEDIDQGRDKQLEYAIELLR